MKKKSPIKKEKLRRMPGQSLDNEISKKIDDLLFAILSPLIFFVISLMEFSQWYFKTDPNPLIYLIIFILSLIYGIYKFLKTKKNIQKLKMARDGEVAVGQQLELLREYGCRIYHDILGDNFNIDHVIISEKGIFIIETKTYSKPEKGESKIVYDGKHLNINGYHIGDSIIKQAKAEQNWLKESIKEALDITFDIKSIVVFPGWYIKSSTSLSETEVWVLNPKALPKLIGNMQTKLSKEDMMKISYTISKFLS